MTALGDHAIAELDIVGAVDPIRSAVITVVGTLADLDATTDRVTALGYINTLLKFLPLTPLTNDPAQWIDRSAILGERPYWQSSRNPDAWTHDHGDTYYLLSQPSQIYTSDPA